MVARNIKEHDPTFKDPADTVTVENDMTLSGANTFSGANTHSGANTFSGANTYSSTNTYSVGLQCTSVSRVATSDGTGTGTIASGGKVITVTSTDNDFIIILPTAVPGMEIMLIKDTSISTAGYEIRTHFPQSCSINGGTGSAAESAIGSTVPLVILRAVTTAAWIGQQYANTGGIISVEPAA